LGCGDTDKRTGAGESCILMWRWSMNEKEVKEDVMVEDVMLKNTTEIYVLLLRAGTDFWYALQGYKTEGEIRQCLDSLSFTAYKIIKVSGLPIDIKATP
jgi:hypothetical protein